MPDPTPTRVRPRSRAAGRLALVLLALTAAFLPPAAPSASAQEPAPAGTYTNPVTQGVVDTFPDPSIIRGKDGSWYAFGTQNPVFQSKGEDGERMLPILRSADMVHWTYAGQVFTPNTQPAWHKGSRLWAPDIRYSAGAYQLTYSVPDRNTVGLATAPTPTGPWTDKGAVLPGRATRRARCGPCRGRPLRRCGRCSS
ncbi:family 43 glycosylhydrolase, partial [Streptomyces sp. NPDC005349]|uniref:family 43 glycosylhydrolase n=1 Tax=Streptomyces sp. NPDC005349 TaxID=3157037 RepID=UPI0033A42479